MDPLTLIVILVVLLVILPHFGVAIPEPLGKILGIIVFVILVVYLLRLI